MPKITKYERALTPVIDILLMVVITIILASALMYPNIQESAPIANLLIEARNFPQNVTAGDCLLEASSGPGGSISPAGKMYVLTGSNVTFNMVPVDNYKVLDVLVDGASVGPVSNYIFNNVSSSHSIQANFTVDFNVQDHMVVPEGNFTINATVLGSAITSGAGGYNLPVTCLLKFGDSNLEYNAYTPWGDYTKALDGNLNDGKNPRFWESPISFKAGTPVRVEACSWKKNGRDSTKNSGWTKFITVDTSTNPSNLNVLKNGDRVPDTPGFDNQASIKDIVSDYVENGSIKLKENEAIYLFELGTADLGSSVADFQDLVVLISVKGVDTPQPAAVSQDTIYPQDMIYPQEMVSRLVIQHLGGDTIDFESPEDTKVILQKGYDQYHLDFTRLGVFKCGDSACIDLEEYGTHKRLDFSPGDRLFIKIVDVRSRSITYAGSVIVK